MLNNDISHVLEHEISGRHSFLNSFQIDNRASIDVPTQCVDLLQVATLQPRRDGRGFEPKLFQIKVQLLANGKPKGKNITIGKAVVDFSRFCADTATSQQYDAILPLR